MSKVLLPNSDTSMGGAHLLAGAVLRAADILKLKGDVQIKWANGTRIGGAYRQRTEGRTLVHVITVSTYASAADASETLWHELTHAKQAENAGGWHAMRRDPRHRSQWGDYHTSPYEVQAREWAAKMHPQLPLADQKAGR